MSENVSDALKMASAISLLFVMALSLAIFFFSEFRLLLRRRWASDGGRNFYDVDNVEYKEEAYVLQVKLLIHFWCIKWYDEGITILFILEKWMLKVIYDIHAFMQQKHLIVVTNSLMEMSVYGLDLDDEMTRALES